MKPFSQACENNKGPILEVIRLEFASPCTVLEIGSGTGQHAVHFARALPHLVWQPTDRTENLDGIRLWRDEAGLGNLRPPLELDVNVDPWPVTAVDAAFTANTMHIMSWAEVEILMHRLGGVLQPEAAFVSYGPYNRSGKFTSPSNARFDQQLRAADPLSGLRDIDDLEALGALAGLRLVQEIDLPANNKVLIWRKNPGRP